MKNRQLPSLLFCALTVSLLAGCTYPISQELREEARPGLTFSMVLKDPTVNIGSIVIWGGRIIENQTGPEGTDLTILDMPLSNWERPENEEQSRGRFIARSAKFLDPELYRRGRKVTVAGEIVGKETKKLGSLNYTYPVVKVKEIHLWKRKKIYAYPPPDYYWWNWGWYGPYGPGWGPFGPWSWPYGPGNWY
jgi:outer membrane lipoprotein